MTEVVPWVRELLGGAGLGDGRRDRRFLRLVSAAATRPDGRVSACIDDKAERQAAYDFLEHEQVSSAAVTRAICAGAMRACAKHREVLVALDGSSLTLTDRTDEKGFGSVGDRRHGRKGLKVISALAMTPAGATIGLVGQEWWAREGRAPKKSQPRPLEERESYRWHLAVKMAGALAATHAKKTKLHFLADREGDASLLMQRLSHEGHLFTIRANGTRNVLTREGKPVNVRAFLSKKAPCVRYELNVPARGERRARRARMELRFASVQLVMRDRHIHRHETMAVSVVWAKELGGGKERLDWMLYTPLLIDSAKSAETTVQRYAYRWRIEDFHRAWKSGGCNVERMQLRSKDAAIKWASVLAVVAARAQQLKAASRETPNAPAREHFSADEIEALVTLKRIQKAKNETITDEPPNLEVAVRWLSDLGGYIGPRNGPPGATVIRRGLERIAPLAMAIPALRAAGKLR